MNVRELIAALSRIDPDMPVIIENREDVGPDLMEIAHVRIAKGLSRDPDMSARHHTGVYEYPRDLSPNNPRRHAPTTEVLMLG